MSGRGVAVAACTKPGVLAVLSMEDTIDAANEAWTLAVDTGGDGVAATLGYHVTCHAAALAKAALVFAHGEPNDMDRARWRALTAEEKREAIEAGKRKVLR